MTLNGDIRGEATGREPSIQYVPLPMTGDPGVMAFHRHLLEDRLRTQRFLDAIARLVKPGDVVADVGSGTGILAFACCRAGARRVYAIERNRIVSWAQELARTNGFTDRITFLEQEASAVRLAEPVDVVVSECLGFMGIGRLMGAVEEFARAHLRPEGVTIPEKCVAYVAPVDSRAHFDYVHLWDAQPLYGFDFSALQQAANSNAYVAWFQPSSLLAECQEVASTDLRRDVTNSWGCELTFVSQRRGHLHGFAGWFEADLGPGIGLSSSPYSEPTIWRQVFLPLEREVSVEEGSVVQVELLCRVAMGSNEKDDYFTWKTEVRHPNVEDVERTIRQSTRRVTGVRSVHDQGDGVRGGRT